MSTMIETQTVSEQLAKFNAATKRLAINIDNNRGYNPGLCLNLTKELHGKYLLAYRRIKATIGAERVDLVNYTRPEVKQSSLIFCGLDSDYNILWEKELRELSCYIGDIRCMPEDGRLFWWKDNLFCAYTRAIRNAHTYSIIKNKQHIIQIHPKNNIQKIPLNFGNNSELCNETEKNWQFFVDGDELRFVYNIYNSHTVIDPFTSEKWVTNSTCFDEWIKQHGTPHGGTPPILLPTGEYLSFFNSHKQLMQLDMAINPTRLAENPTYYTDKLKRQYRIGAYCFTGVDNSYKITRISKEPFIIGTEKEGFAWRSMTWKPLAVFATGAIYENNNFKLAYGVNDCWSEIATISEDEVFKNLINI